MVTSLNYIGIVMNSNGEFTFAVKSLNDNGMPALFKIHTILKSQKVQSPIVLLKLFDLIVKPILLCGYQVRGNNYINYESEDIHHLDRIPFEEVQNKYCKLLKLLLCACWPVYIKHGRASRIVTSPTDA